jgi:hypothetical protein
MIPPVVLIFLVFVALYLIYEAFTSETPDRFQENLIAAWLTTLLVGVIFIGTSVASL